jgi:hypothetical protein
MSHWDGPAAHRATQRIGWLGRLRWVSSKASKLELTFLYFENCLARG